MSFIVKTYNQCGFWAQEVRVKDPELQEGIPAVLLEPPSRSSAQIPGGLVCRDGNKASGRKDSHIM